MQFRVSAGMAAISAAASLHAQGDDNAFQRLSGDGAFVVFDATGLTGEAAVTVLQTMWGDLDGAIPHAETPLIATALSDLKQIIVGLERDVQRDLLPRASAVGSAPEADVANAGSHELPTADASTSDSSQQSSEATKEENANVTEQAESGEAAPDQRRKRR